MTNIMQQFRAKNKVSRNGYDLSKRLCFTAKAGELLPTYSRLMMVGDKAEVGNFWETTTAPVNTAAYTRFKEYYEWYFVPLNLLWNKFNSWSTNLKNQTQSATSINGAQSLSDDHPYFTTVQVQSIVSALELEGSGATYLNQFGFNRGTLSAKLLHYLGYGDFSTFGSGILEDFRLSPWRLLAYQKVCQDWHRNTQWENSAPERFNLNYITGSSESLEIPLSQLNLSRQTMFDLQYANWNKDLFMGLLPNAQYGDAASVNLGTLEGSLNLNLGSASEYLSTGLRVLPQQGSPLSVTQGTNVTIGTTSTSLSQTSNILTAGPNLRFGLSASEVQSLRDSLGLTTSSTGTGSINSAFTILALRQAEALQKYKEITQSNPNDFPAQKEAHFGYRPNEAYSERSRLIHSVSSNIEIRPVINQNITENSDSSLNAADVAGYGHGTGSGKPKTFTADVDGVLMCIYHVVPLLDYALPRIDPDNLKTAFTDYAIPEFDKTGMVQVPFAWLTNGTPFSATDTFTLDSKLLGYAPNYIEYKTDVDEVKGAFYNGGLEAWVAPITKEYLAKYLFKNTTPTGYFYRGLNANFFKINPTITDSIFSGEVVNSFSSTDKFWVNCYHDVSMVRPLDRDGLPY